MRIIGRIGTGKTLFIRQAAKAMNMPIIEIRTFHDVTFPEIFKAILRWLETPQCILCFDGFQDCPQSIKRMIKDAEIFGECLGRYLIIIEDER